MLPLDRLIVIAGPSCCGKTLFIEKLRNGDLPDMAEVLGMSAIPHWDYIDSYYLNSTLLREIERSSTRGVLLHWTIPPLTTKILFRNVFLLFKHDRKERLRILELTHRLTVLTLYTSRDSLISRVNSRRARIKSRRKDGEDGWLSYQRKMHNTHRLKRIYSDPDKLDSMYRRWFDFCDSLEARESHLINLEGEPVIAPTGSWREITNRWKNEVTAI